MKRGFGRKIWCLLLVMLISMAQISSMAVQAVDISDLATESKQPIVLTLGADLSEDQKNLILQFFGIDINSVTVITITNQDEQEKLGNLISADKIGSHTYSCALVNPTNAGGIQVKTANLNYVTSNMIASQLSTSGVYNCEVLTAAPFEVSGTGALTGVMMAYEEASGKQLEDGKKELANVELVTTGSIAETVGQDQATLVVNDIKINIVRDNIKEENEVHEVVDNVISVTETAAEEAAANQGKSAPAKLGEVEKTELYDFGYQFSQMDYDYAQMQPTLERVTYNVATSSGIEDPIIDTFTTITDEQVLPSNSILLGTNDEIWGDDAIIDATSDVAVSDRPADPIHVYTGEVTLTSAGGVKADEFIKGTNIIAYKDLNGSYALMDLNGNLLTESIYQRDLIGSKGYIEARLSDDSGKAGILAPDGSTVVDFQYDTVEVVGSMWALGIILKLGTEDDFDYAGSQNYYIIDYADVYYLGTQGTQCVGRLTRDECYDYFSKADYINIKARSGVITTYDSSFTPVQTAESILSFGAYDYDDSLEEALAEKTGYYVSSFYGKYAEISDGSGKGIVDRYGNVIIPMQFDYFAPYYINDTEDSSYYEAGGYFFSEGDQTSKFVTAGGNVTASFDYGTDTADYITNYGMTAMVRKGDDDYILLSGDGVETDLGNIYSYLSCLKESKGLLWCGDTDNGSDLIDWHGNVLISGSKGYSVSANGKYLIARDGYTSSTLYMIDDAEPVDLANSAGGAQEMQVETSEGSSLDAYEGGVEVENAGTVLSQRFVSGADVLKATNDGDKYALMDVTDTQLTEPKYSGNIDTEYGWLVVQDADSQKYGVLSQKGQTIVPCEYDEVQVLSDKWIIAYVLKETASEDYDYEDYNNNRYQIDTAKIFCVNEDTVSSVEVTRDQLEDVYAEGDYINIQDRTTGNVVTYDTGFNAVASVNYVTDMGDFSENTVLAKQLSDKTGYTVSTIGTDGYACAAAYSNNTTYYGVINMNGEVVVPLEYTRVDLYATDRECDININGYFCVEKVDKWGYVTKGGEVSCELKYDRDNFFNVGMAARYNNGDGTYTLVAADGTESGPYSNYLNGYAKGLLFVTSTVDGEEVLLDWHGNEVLKGYQNYSFSDNGKYFIAQQSYDKPYELFTINGAEVVGVSGDTVSNESVNSTAVSETETEITAESAESESQAAGTRHDESETEANVEEKKDAATTETASKDSADTTTEAASNDDAAVLLESAITLVEADAAANKTEIVTLLDLAKTKAGSDNDAVSSIIGSAITLMNVENPDANSVSALLKSALAMLE